MKLSIAKCRTSILFALCFVSVAGISSASVIFDSGNPAFVGTTMTSFRLADDFVLAAAANVTDVRFYGSAFAGSTFPGNFSGSVTYVFYNNSAGALGTVITSGTVNSLTGALWGVCGTGNCYTVDFALNAAVPLTAGTYWLELHEGATVSTSDGTTVTWAGLNSTDTGNSRFSNNLANPPNTLPASGSRSDRAFVLSDNSANNNVPEPSSAALLLLGGGLAALYRRRLQRS